MTCPRCQQDNPPHARFCLGCGARLVLACGACGAELPGGARFCLQCGQAVAGSVTAPIRSPTPETYTPKHLAERILTSKAALEGERKQVTVLFADLKGSMELLADRDPEEARKLLDPVLEHMMEAVHRYEGTVNQIMGDGIMALFGAPLAHEDHAVRACYAAIDLQAAMRRYGEEVRRAHGVTIEVRVGLNSGDVVVRAIGSDLHTDYSAVGQTTHLAARMEQLASRGSTLITTHTLRLVEGYIEVRPVGPIPVKGLPEPVEVYELIGAGPRRSRLHAAAARGLTRFVGRDAELEQGRRILARASVGQGQVLALVGEPGVGKSRFVWEITHSHRGVAGRSRAMTRVDRRAFLVGTLAFLAASLATEAQQAERVFLIGVLGHSSASAYAGRTEAFRQGLRDLGYVEGKNIELEYRWSEGKQDRLPALATELVRRKVDVIVTHSVGVLAAKHATTSIPIVMAIAGDPVGTGLVASLARPGGNVTGLSLGTEEGLSGKKLQLLTEVMPQLSRVGVLWNRANPGVASQVADIQGAARTLGVHLQLVEFRGSDELESALAALASTRSDALIVPADAAAFQQRARLVAFTATHHLPAIYAQRETVEAGGLMAYASSQIDAWRRAATYVDKILRGAKPTDLPIEEPTKFELVINLKTAKALGLTIPPAVLARADEVIQ